MSQPGWVRVDRKLFDHEVFQREPLTEREAWLWLIMNAAWEAHGIRVRNELQKIERGQLVGARSYLAKQWRWGEKRVRNFLDLLETQEMIKRASSGATLVSVITICNYEKFQSATQCEGQQKGQLGASSGPEYKTKEQESSTPAYARAHARDVIVLPDQIVGPARADGEPAFVVDLKAVDIQAALQAMPAERARSIAEQCARDWAANRKMPQSPMATISRAIREDRMADETHQHRKAQIKRPATAAGGVEQHRDNPTWYRIV